MKQRKVGRPKMAKNKLKKGISVKLKPETFQILKEADGKNNSLKIDNAIVHTYSKAG